MEIRIRHSYAAPAEKVWGALKTAIIRHPDIQGKKIQWSARRGEGKYAGCRISLELTAPFPDTSEVEAVISGPVLILSFMEDRIRMALKDFLSGLKL